MLDFPLIIIYIFIFLKKTSGYIYLSYHFEHLVRLCPFILRKKERPYTFCSSESGQREYKVTNVFINILLYIILLLISPVLNMRLQSLVYISEI